MASASTRPYKVKWRAASSVFYPVSRFLVAPSVLLHIQPADGAVCFCRHIASVYLLDEASVSYCPRTWSAREFWQNRLLYTTARDGLELERLMAVCPEWYHARKYSRSLLVHLVLPGILPSSFLADPKHRLTVNLSTSFSRKASLLALCYRNLGSPGFAHPPCRHVCATTASTQSPAFRVCTFC